MPKPLELAHLNFAPEGAETAPPLLIAHGLFGSARNFNTLARRLATGRRVVAVDMRNHGASPWSDDMGYGDMAADLALMVETLCGGEAVVLGHSMGGKAAMALALTQPKGLSALLVADIAPVAYGHTHSGYLEAMAGVDLTRVTRRSDADPLLADAIPEAPLRSFILQNLVIEDGSARWRINIDALASAMDALIGFPDFGGASWEGQALFLHGDASDYLPDNARPEIARRFPAAEIEAIAGAGHWLHAEKPGEFLAAVSAWLDGLHASED